MGAGSAVFEGDVFKDKIRVYESMLYGFGYICLPTAILAVDKNIYLAGVDTTRSRDYQQRDQQARWCTNRNGVERYLSDCGIHTIIGNHQHVIIGIEHLHVNLLNP